MTFKCRLVSGSKIMTTSPILPFFYRVSDPHIWFRVTNMRLLLGHIPWMYEYDERLKLMNERTGFLS